MLPGAFEKGTGVEVGRIEVMDALLYSSAFAQPGSSGNPDELRPCPSARVGSQLHGVIEEDFRLFLGATFAVEPSVEGFSTGEQNHDERCEFCEVVKDCDLRQPRSIVELHHKEAPRSRV